MRRHVDVESLHHRRWLRDRRRVEDAYVPREPGDHEVLVHGGDGPRRHGAAGVDQQFEPFAEALRVETLVAARLSAAPEIEVEDRRQLRWCRRGDDLSTGVESAVPDQLMQRLWRKVRHHSREVWRIQQAREGTLEGARLPLGRSNDSRAAGQRCGPAWTRAGVWECGADRDRCVSPWAGDDTGLVAQQTVLNFKGLRRIVLLGRLVYRKVSSTLLLSSFFVTNLIDAMRCRTPASGGHRALRPGGARDLRPDGGTVRRRIHEISEAQRGGTAVPTRLAALEGRHTR